MTHFIKYEKVIWIIKNKTRKTEFQMCFDILGCMLLKDVHAAFAIKETAEKWVSSRSNPQMELTSTMSWCSLWSETVSHGHARDIKAFPKWEYRNRNEEENRNQEEKERKKKKVRERKNG